MNSETITDTEPTPETPTDSEAETVTEATAGETAAGEAAETPVEVGKTQSTGTKWKYRIIKAIDVAGLTFLTPVVRLATGEEPRKQLVAISQMIVIPALTFLMFIMAWNYMAPKHKTKSGEVPTPEVVWNASESIWRFHDREMNKETAYNLSGPQREQALKAVQIKLAKLKPLEKKANDQVKAAEKKAAEEVALAIAPIEATYNKSEQSFLDAQKKRVAELTAEGKSLEKGDKAALKKYLASVREHSEKTEAEQELLKEIKADIEETRSAKQPIVVAALKYQTRVAEERQYLGKLEQLLSTSNLGTKVENSQHRLEEQMQQVASVVGTEAAFEKAEKVVTNQIRLEKMQESTYAQPWTLPMQIYRSVFCVFVGFLLGTAIAVPLGILCGLSRTIMSALTPFIALFKPVSPIVWLPIALIIVGGFIQDPDKHWLMQMLANAPLIGWMKINPAFMACAITVALCSLWATMVNTAFGVASIEKDHLNVAAVLRLGFKDRLFKIIIPSALPLIFAGLRISLGVGWMVLIAAELLSSSEGIGKFVWDQFSNGASDSFAKMFVVVFVVGLIGLLLDRIMIVFQRLVTFDGAPTAI